MPKLKIHAEEIYSIKGNPSKFSDTQVNIECRVTDAYLHDLFIQIWETVGDEGLEAWLAYEHLALTPRKPEDFKKDFVNEGLKHYSKNA